MRTVLFLTITTDFEAFFINAEHAHSAEHWFLQRDQPPDEVGPFPLGH